MRKFIILIICLASSSQAFACDVCGGKLGGLNLGLAPSFNGHFIGFKYSQAHFNAFVDYGSQYLENESSDDVYYRMDLIGRVTISKRWQLNVILPYLYNEMDGSHQNVTLSGVGDPMFLVYHQVLNKQSNTGYIGHNLLFGGGLKLPLGDFENLDQGEIINRNFQLGSGSFDYLLTSNYSISYKKLGLNIEGAYKYNTGNKDDYRFGNQVNASGNIYYTINASGFSLLPFFGGYFEAAGKHQDNAIEVANTGGQAWFASLGTEVYAGNFTLSTQYQIPISQDYNVDQFSSIEAGSRYALSILWNIGG
ncbi:hypothetical protein E1176_17180 [Fulvivirga sp. RKSG066]|nr:hypothetical protein [Fulvivirga aurantia]